MNTTNNEKMEAECDITFDIQTHKSYTIEKYLNFLWVNDHTYSISVFGIC